MNSYLFKKIQNRFISFEPLNNRFADSDSLYEKVRSTSLKLKTGQCFELIDETIVMVNKAKDLINYYNLIDLKFKKLEALQTSFNLSKKITIKNGKTLTIDYNNICRKHFINILQTYVYKIVPEEEISKHIVTYFQDGLQISMPSVFWNKLFHDSFSKDLAVDLREYILPYNKKLYGKYFKQINVATTANELSDITFEFYNPEGVVVDITAGAEKLKTALLGRSDYDFLINFIDNHRGSDGKIHLIREI